MSQPLLYHVHIQYTNHRQINTHREAQVLVLPDVPRDSNRGLGLLRTADCGGKTVNAESADSGFNGDLGVDKDTYDEQVGAVSG